MSETAQAVTARASSLEALTTFGKQDMLRKVINTGRAEQARKTVNRGEELDAIRKEGLTNEDVLRVIKESGKVKFNASETEALVLRFGAGAMEKDENGEYKLSESFKGRGELEASFNEGKEAVEPITRVLRYLEIVQEADASNIPLDRLSDFVRSKGVDNWDALRDGALDTLIALPSVQASLPELKDMSLDLQRLYVDATLGHNTKLRAKISQRMKAFSGRLSEEVLEKDPELAKSEGEKTQLEKEVTEGVGRFVQELKGLGWDMDESTEQLIERMVREGKSASSIRDNLVQRFQENFKAQNSDAYNWLGRHTKAKKAFELAEKEKQASRDDSPDSKKTYEKKYTQAQTELRNIEEELENEPVKQQGVQLFQAAMSRLGTGGGTALTPEMQEINDLSVKAKSLKTKEQEIQAKKPQAEKREKREIAKKLKAESDLVDEIKTILDEAVVDTVIEQIDETTRLEEMRLAKEAEKAQEEGERNVLERMRTNWIRYEGTGYGETGEGRRRKRVDRQKIGDDMKYLAYNGEEGLQKLILRDFLGRNDAGWQNIELSQLAPEEKKIFDKTYSKLKDQYRQKLFSDYFTARTVVDRTFAARIGKHYFFEGTMGKLSLKAHEWQLLDQHFGKSIDEALAKSNEGSGALQKLKERGIVPNFKQKWLILMLISLGLLAGSGFGLPVLGAAPFIGGAALRG